MQGSKGKADRTGTASSCCYGNMYKLDFITDNYKVQLTNDFVNYDQYIEKQQNSKFIS